MAPARKGHRHEKNRDLQFCEEENEIYAVVRKNLGHGRYLVIDADRTERQGAIRGALRQAKIFPGNVVMLALRPLESEFDDDKVRYQRDGDIILIYTNDEVSTLKKLSKISRDFESLADDAVGDDIGGGAGVEFVNNAASEGDNQDIDIDDI